ncbi:MAG: hypothetical protein V1867_01890 [Candidatus Falkowbacteria bacterium]
MDQGAIRDTLGASRNADEFLSAVTESVWREFYVQSAPEEYSAVLEEIEVRFGRTVLRELFRLNHKTDWEGTGE